MNLPNEKRENRVHQEYTILDTLPEQEYDEITQLASYICESPISLITLIEGDRQFHKSHHGTELKEGPSEYSFCIHAMKKPDDFTIITDARKDERFKDNPYVVNEPHIVFYAGYPIKDSSGIPLASICVIDYKPRELKESQKLALKTLSNQVGRLLELKKSRLALEIEKKEAVHLAQRLGHIIESTNSGTWEWNVKSDTLVFGPKWGESFGYSPDEMIGFGLKQWKGLIHPEDLEVFSRQLKQCLSKNSNFFNLEYRMKHKNGSWVWLHGKGKVISWSLKEEPLVMFGTQSNIQGEKLAKQRLSSFADNIPGIVMSFELRDNKEFKLVYVSKGFEELWGIPLETIKKDGERIWANIFEEDLSSLQESIKVSVERMDPWNFEWRIYDANTKIKWLKGIGRPVKNHDGTIFLDAIILDFSEEKCTLHALEERKQFIEKTLENVPLGIAVNKIDSGEATIINKRFTEIYGWPQEELTNVDNFFEKIYPNPEYRKKIKNQILSDIQSGDIEKMSWDEVKIVRKDGQMRIVNAKNIPLPNQNLMISTVVDVTENHRDKELILEFNERFKYVTKATSDTIWDWDLLEDFVVYGENFEENFGHKLSSNSYENAGLWEKCLHPDDKERAVKSIQDALKGATTKWKAEYRFQKSDHSYMDIVDEGYIVRNKGGMPIRMVGAMKDITGQKKQEERLRIFESVINKSNDPIVISDAEPIGHPYGPRIIYVNEAFVKQTGYSRAEIIGKTPRILQGPKTDRAVLKQVSEDLKAWKNIDVDLINYSKSGKEFWVNLSIAPVANEKGWYTHWISIQKDITQHKQREQQLRIFESVIAKSNDPIIITEAGALDYPDGPKIIYANESFTKLTGYGSNEIIGKTPRILQGPKSDKKVLKKIGEDLRAWKSINEDILNYTKSGEEFWVNLSITPIADDKGWYTHWIAIQKDITENKKRELYQNFLSEVSNVFNKEKNLKSALIGVGELLHDYGGYDIVEPWLVGSDLDVLNKFTSYIARKKFKDFEADKQQLKSIKKGIGLPGVTWQQEKVQHWDNLPEHELFIRREKAKKTGLLNGTGLPLSYNNSITGVLLLLSEKSTRTKTSEARFFREFGAFLGSEIARKQLEEELDQFMTHTSDCICSFDKNGDIKRFNPSFSILFGMEKNQSNIKFLDIIHPADRDRISKEITNPEKRNQSTQIEARCISQNNKNIWINWTITPDKEFGTTYCDGKNITEKKELEDLLEVATELSQIGSWEIDLTEGSLYWSKVTRRIYEVPDDYIPDMEKGINFIRDAKERERIIGIVRDVILHSESFEEEVLITTHKGKEKWIKVIAETEKANGKALRLFGSVQDIHKRKLAELERIEILESIGDGFFAVDADWVVTYWNQQAEHILKVSKTDILGKSLWEVFDKVSDSIFYSNFKTAQQGRGGNHFEGYFESLGIWLDVSVNTTIEANGLTVYFKDVTIRKDAMEEIKISNERFSKVVKATQDAIWDWDVTSQNVFWGSGFFDRFGHSPSKDGITLETWSNLIHPEDQKRVFKASTNALKNINLEYYTNEYRLRKSDGTYAYVVDNACIIRNERGAPLRAIGAIQDISERKEYEYSLEKLNRQLEKKARQLTSSNAELEQFAYVTSHDLQEPLRMITSFLSLLEKKYSDKIDDKGKRYINFAVDGAKKMREIILELLEYSRVGDTLDKMELVDVNEIIKEVVLLNKKQIAETNAVIDVPEMPTLKSVKSPLRQVFLNLISNALKYTKDGIVPKISIACAEEAGFWKFTVKDNGIGIPEEYKDKIFIIFQRLHNPNEYSGLGMGLAITKKIIETLGGKIKVNSGEGEGSEFIFTIKKKQ